MTEEFLSYIWQYRLFAVKSKTTEGIPLEIISVGERNTDSGPDFINAKIKIGKTVWAGNVEVHVNASDWHLHKHQNDKAYKNVILHVVYNNDADIYRNNDEKILAFELKDKYSSKLYDNYRNFIESTFWIPCQNMIANVDKIVTRNWLEVLLVKRLERKVEDIERTLIFNNNDWEQTFYQNLARSFGFKVNAEPFEMLAKATPFEYLAKHRDKLFQLEAILLGQAGLLDKEFEDEYPAKLKIEYKYLKHKFSLQSINEELWKFMRLRPANFPYIRIAQFAYLINKTPSLFSKAINAKDIEGLNNLFKIKTSEYWENHFIPDRVSRKQVRKFGEISIRNIILNTVVPFVFLYGVKKDNFAYREKALKYLEMLDAEANNIINKWESIGLKAENAFESQALLELKNEFCTKKRCLECRIGNQIIRL